MMPLFGKNPTALAMYETIVKYNANKNTDEQIKFLHGGSSAVFAFIGKTVNVWAKNNQFFQTQIPASLIPTGELRKKYNMYPVSGELEVGAFNYGSRKAGINYYFLSGMDASYEGICTTLGYAKQSTRLLTLETIQNNIYILIHHMSKSDFQRSLKMLLMEMTNLMLMNENSNETGKKYLSLLVEKRDALLSQFPGNQEIFNYFDKYLPKLTDIISGRLPIQANNEFLQSIIEQYPVIYCSTINSREFTDGHPNERIVRGKINFDTIKILFTPTAFVDSLQSTLDNLSLSSIQVVGYSIPGSYNHKVLLEPLPLNLGYGGKS